MTAKKRGRPKGSRNGHDTAPASRLPEAQRPYCLRYGSQFWIVPSMIGGRVVSAQESLRNVLRLQLRVPIFGSLADAVAAAYPAPPELPRGAGR